MTGTAVPVKFFRYPERKRYIPIQGNTSGPGDWMPEPCEKGAMPVRRVPIRQ